MLVGQATVELTQFQKVIGVDPSSKMIEQARQSSQSQYSPGQIEFKHSKAEDLGFLADGSVDLIVSGSQASH